jgi:hypothetical protein
MPKILVSLHWASKFQFAGNQFFTVELILPIGWRPDGVQLLYY